MIVEIINRLLEIPELAAVNRVSNPLYTGAGKLPAAIVRYTYRADGLQPVSIQTDVLEIELTTVADVRNVGAMNYDAHIDLDRLILGKLHDWSENAEKDKWRVISGGNIQIDDGFYKSSIQYQRDIYLDSCEA